MSAKIQVKRGTTAQWADSTTNDTTLAPGQPGVEYCTDGSTKLKIGPHTADGSGTEWANIEYISSGVGKKDSTQPTGEIFNDYTNNVASGNYSHAEGSSTTASSMSSHAEGSGTTASGLLSHAEGSSTTASGYASHAQNASTTAAYEYQTAMGILNNNKSNTLLEIGNGTPSSTRSNAFEVYKDGHAEVQTMGTTDNSVVIKSALDTKQGKIGTLSNTPNGLSLNAGNDNGFVISSAAPNSTASIKMPNTDEIGLYTNEGGTHLRVTADDIVISQPYTPKTGASVVNKQYVDDKTEVIKEESAATTDTPITYGTTAPTTTTKGQVYLQVDAYPDIRVIESGTYGIWSYRKWSDGKCELSGENVSTIPITTQVGNGYRSDPVDVDLPFTVYDIVVTCDCNDLNTWASSFTYRMVKGNTTVQYILWRTGAYEAISWYAHIHVSGRWK